MTSSPASDLPVTLADIKAAAERLRGKAIRTPLLNVPALDDELGFRLFIKAEPLQRTGSFKFRGAYNTMALLDPEARARGVVAFSSGNHAQGVAAAAQLLGIRSTIVMPKDAPSIKIENTRSYGAEVVLYDRDREDREAIARRIAEDRGATTVKPFDDVRIIAGQGTTGLEIAEQAADAGVTVDAVIANCSGGGLVTGCAVALAALSPTTEVYSSEPAEYDDMARSLSAGTRQTNAPASRSFCDALLAPMPGEITFSIARRLLAGGFSADDAAVARAMALAFERFKLVIEPGGAVSLACALQQRDRFRGRTVVVVASGGNVDRVTFAKALAA
ncbi:MAG: threonine/serine dehydratase [Rhodospirillales bacterium]|nr:threonine/serine dehydratase [Rhodospirillales bacterium]